MEASSSIKAPGPVRYGYDVFISFRGTDTRDGFVSHLYHALTTAGINVFKDDEGLREGEDISFGLRQAICSSRTFVVVFSTNYANSRWCLDELDEITKWIVLGRQMLILPVFYGVASHDVWTQISNFERRNGEELPVQKIRRWLEAFKAAGAPKGLDLICKNEAQLVKHIVEWSVHRKIAATLMDQLQTRSQFGQPGVPSLLTTASSWKYDVFLSYRGVDTRLSFTSNLFAALKQAGINTLKDDESLLVGEEIPFGLSQAIRGSRVSVVVLSSNFAGSTWCLEELAEIMKWRQTTGQLVLPVFYGVNPSDVRKQRESFSQAFARHEEVFSSENEKNQKIARWREALTEVGHLSGWVVGNSTYRDEATVIWDIVRKIGTVMNEQTCLHVASFPVGLDSYQQDINLLLSPGSGGVRFVGIVGMGGIGKTTLAKAIYNQFSCHFEGKSFLANVRMNSEQPNDAVRLQEQLLLDILMFKQMQVRVSNIHQGKSIIKERLRGKRVLIVLDDVSDLDQVRALAGDREWFGSGSRIILTTRYQHILEAVKVDSSYKVKSLDDSQSLQLFCSHAFGQSCPREEFSELSKQILGYSKGVPLALEILGSSLRDKTEEEWNDALKKLNMIPDYRIQAQLKISFDELGNDDRVKELFLDIACFFVGLDKDYVITILEACGLFAKKGMRDLIDKCLVEVDGKNRLQMHDLLRDMGREIVREKSPNNPGKRSRLWLHEDILSTIQSELGSKKVEGIAWNISESKMVTMSAEGFAPMKRLRLLKLKNVHIEGLNRD